MLTEKYTCDYHNSVYYPCWSKAIGYIYRQVLELGCGTGQFAKMLDEVKPPLAYTGVDIDKEAIEHAKKLNPLLKFYVQDVYNIVWDKIKAETVCAFQIFEHLDRDISLISAIPKGKRLVFSVPNFWSKDHRRVFKDEKSIYKRYFYLIDIREVKEFTTLKRESPGISNKIFLTYGIKR